MREARIIAPMNAGAIPELQGALTKLYNGYTRSVGMGAWVDDLGKIVQEPVYLYDIAMSEGPVSAAMLRGLALRWGHKAGEKAVYVRYASGEVEVISITAEKHAAA